MLNYSVAELRINNNIAGDVLGKNIVLLHSKKDILKKVDKELDIEMLK